MAPNWRRVRSSLLTQERSGSDPRTVIARKRKRRRNLPAPIPSSSTASNRSSRPTIPFTQKIARLTQQEEKQGLLDDTATIGTRQGWERRLAARGFVIRGHRLMRRRESNHESDESRE